MVMSCRIVLAAVMAGVALGCAKRQPDQPMPDAVVSKPEAAGDDARRRNMRDVMQAKAAFANSLISSMATANFESIELNATELSWLSQRAEWHVSDTVEYRGFSERFRHAADRMAGHAQRQDLAALADAYSTLTASCIECHRYMRGDGFETDVPELPQ